MHSWFNICKNILKYIFIIIGGTYFVLLIPFLCINDSLKPSYINGLFAIWIFVYILIVLIVSKCLDENKKFLITKVYSKLSYIGIYLFNFYLLIKIVPPFFYKYLKPENMDENQFTTYFCSLITVGVTILGIGWTLKENRHLTEQQIKENRKQMQEQNIINLEALAEERRLSVLPLITIFKKEFMEIITLEDKAIIDKSNEEIIIEFFESGKIKFNPCITNMQRDYIYKEIDNAKNINGRIISTFLLRNYIFSNAGIGAAINIQLFLSEIDNGSIKVPKCSKHLI
ncbi:hypothetical protein [Aminipila terrae]|uniref:Uncharacterized protein n=1 Tax=Aminipila terrae TaxID=2697030 RepID=A0A6P1MF69_9FIRM|nr:hypothetical protein [Aminipila terrae]QHI72682.1 hypothetical protein Ami3637_09975 [Aminipila terrae]